jgi:imidazoleglycerol-phosphate dehydratase / histidinol-phosphatase
MKKILFIDRDGTVNKEAPPTYQIDSFDKLEFYPAVFTWLGRIASEFDFELVMVTNQDGLGTDAYPESSFLLIQQFVITALANEGIHFKAVHIDRTYPAENAPTRKPGIGMLTGYLNHPGYDIAGSFVIGDRITDMQLAKNLNCRGIWINDDEQLGIAEIQNTLAALQQTITLKTQSWKEIYYYLKENK